MGCAPSRSGGNVVEDLLAIPGGGVPGGPPTPLAQVGQEKVEFTLTLKDGPRPAHAPSQLDICTKTAVPISKLMSLFESRATVEAAAKGLGTDRFIDLYPSISVPSDALRQIRLDAPDDGPVRNYEELTELVEATRPPFDGLVRFILTKAALDPDATPTVDGKPLPADSFKLYTPAPIKSEARCDEKVFADYNGDYARIIDAVRCSIVLDSVDQLLSIARLLNEKSKTPIKLEGLGTVSFVVMRLKNRFAQPVFNGYQDALYTIELTFAAGIHVLCEIQLHLTALLVRSNANHKHYEYFRKYFTGTWMASADAVETRLRRLNKIGGVAASAEELVNNVLESRDAERLEGLAELVGEFMVDDEPLLVEVERKRLALISAAMESAEVEEGRARAKYRLAYAIWRDGARILATFSPYEFISGGLLEALPLSMEAFEMMKRVLGDEHVDTLDAKHLLANLLAMAGRLDEAEQLLHEVNEGRQRVLGADHNDTLLGRSSLVMLLIQCPRLKEAEQICREVLEARLKVDGEYHYETLRVKMNLAYLYFSPHYDVQNLAEAEPLVRSTLEVRRRWLGEAHRSTLKAKCFLSAVLAKSRQPIEAEQLMREQIDAHQRALGDDAVLTIKAKQDLASLLRTPPQAMACQAVGLFPQPKGRIPESEPLLVEVVRAKQRLLGAEHEEVLRSQSDLAGFYALQEQFHRAEPLWRQLWDVQKRVMGEDHRDTLMTKYNLAWLLGNTRRTKKAAKMFKEVLDKQRLVLGEDHEETALTKRTLRMVDINLGRRAGKY
jgi:tetratricopeptide (TPR) repeat protein